MDEFGKNLEPRNPRLETDNGKFVKLLVLAGADYAKYFSQFASRINSTPYAKLKGNIIYLTSLQVSDKLEKF